MVDLQQKVKMKFVGLLTPFNLLCDASLGGLIDARIAKCMPGTAKSEEIISDLNKGIEIGQNVLLRLSSKKDGEQLKSFSDPIGTQFRLNDYVLESNFETEDSLIPLIQTAQRADDNINCVINALRLLKAGHVEANARIISTIRGSKMHAAPYRMSSLAREDSKEIFGLRTNEIIQVKVLTEKFSSIDFLKRGRLRIAFDRFERSYYEPFLEDQLIDYMIAFEALFIDKKIREQSAVIPIAAAMLLGANEEERQEITETMDQAYNIRNCIVHGSDYEQRLDSNKMNMKKLAEMVENILRNSIKRLI
jgi:hypothetical protein